MSRGRLHINDRILDWGPYKWTYQEDAPFPYHRCSTPCPAAHFRVIGNPFCCWKCFACRKNEILVDNETSCVGCPEKKWPVNANQIECIDIPRTFFTWGDIYGTILVGFAGFVLLLAIILSVIITRKRHLRVVKGSGLQMLLVILMGIYLAFATVFAYIDKPKDGLCIFGRVGFHFSFTLIFGPMLVKTNRIFQIFLASSKLSTKVFMGSDFSQRVALTVIIAVQVGDIHFPQVIKTMIVTNCETYCHVWYLLTGRVDIKPVGVFMALSQRFYSTQTLYIRYAYTKMIFITSVCIILVGCLNVSCFLLKHAKWFLPTVIQFMGWKTNYIP